MSSILLLLLYLSPVIAIIIIVSCMAPTSGRSSSQNSDYWEASRITRAVHDGQTQYEMFTKNNHQMSTPRHFKDYD